MMAKVMFYAATAFFCSVTSAQPATLCDELKSAMTKADNLSTRVGKQIGDDKWEGIDLPKVSGFDECYISKSALGGHSYQCSSLLSDERLAQKMRRNITATISSCFPESEWWYTKSPEGLMFSKLEGSPTGSFHVWRLRSTNQHYVSISFVERSR
ncbi:hypothetical protein ACVWYQ_004728 [Bradyrhizobium sp. USDA 3397]